MSAHLGSPVYRFNDDDCEYRHHQPLLARWLRLKTRKGATMSAFWQRAVIIVLGNRRSDHRGAEASVRVKQAHDGGDDPGRPPGRESRYAPASRDRGSREIWKLTVQSALLSDQATRKSQNRKGAWPDDSRIIPIARRRGDRMRWRMSAYCTKNHPTVARQSPLSGAKRTSQRSSEMSA
jgi:hypothetical protein